jgi:hypothetical protein
MPDLAGKAARVVLIVNSLNLCQVLRSVSKYDKCEDRILPSMSVDMPSMVEVRCQDARVDGETSDGQYVCTVCTEEQEVC